MIFRHVLCNLKSNLINYIYNKYQTMKKFAFVAALAMAFGLTACKKDYTCTCTVDDGMGSVATSSFVIENSSKSDAETACNASVSVGAASSSCTID